MLAFCAFGVISVLAALHPAQAQDAATALPKLRAPMIDNVAPSREQRRVIRFLTGSDFPPFQFVGADGNPVGLNVDLARAICASLDFPCTIQALPWDDLLPALESGRADALIAGLKPSAELRGKAELTRPYFRLPARFVARREGTPAESTPSALAGKSVAVVQGSAHEAFLKAFFPAANLIASPDEEAARAALRESRADLLFDDGASLSLWLGGTGSLDCCVFVPGAYLESHFFGEGMVAATRKGDVRLRQMLDRALDDIEAKGRMTDLYLRWFPIGIF
ncbi:transporter substrate-binding domain-containing protein [Terrihabitans sp. B22-R8]|uniref:transporter substrate-binding domain-containing protein n=1 Tax=Terrihabitans sp. B22-R8 TaxID=3425128 RepID=UPI00403CB86F